MNTGELVKVITEVIGGLGVFLLGMKHMSEGLQAVAGSRLRKMISLVTDNRVMGVFIGMLVTMLIQSSSITTVMVVGFVNSAIMNLMQAIGVILGANIGTTVTGWILVLKIGKWGLPMLGIAAFFFLFSKNERLRYTGMTIMGLGMVFFGLELMKNGFKPIRHMPEFVEWFHAFQATSYLGVLKCALAGCILTCIVQSSSATLGITIGLASTGVIPFQTAAALVLGENIGTTITAYLASLGANTQAKRAAYAHIMFNVLGVAWITAIFPWYLPIIEKLVGADPNMMVLNAAGEETFPHITRGIATVHTVFNVVNTLVFLPFIGVIAKVVTKMAPEKNHDKTRLKYLDVRMLDTPSLGIVQSQEQIDFMAESVQGMLDNLKARITEGQEAEAAEHKIFRREEALDNVQKEIFLYLSQMVGGQVPHDVTLRAHKQMRMADEYETLSDYITTVLKATKKLERNGLELTAEEKQKLMQLHERVSAYVVEVNRFIEKGGNDITAWAYQESAEINNKMKALRREHISRLQEEKVNPLFSLVYTDMLNSYRRMKDHALNIAEIAVGDKI